MNDLKHITIIHPGMNFLGGAERLTVELALGLANMGTNVTIITDICNNIWKMELLKNVKRIFIKEIGEMLSGNIKFWLNIKRYVNKMAKLIDAETNIVIATKFPASFIAHYAKNKLGVKIVHYFHDAPMVLHDKEAFNFLPLKLRFFYTFISKLYAKEDIACVRDSDAFFANSIFCKKVNSKIYGLDESSITLIYPGINLKRFYPINHIPQIIKYNIKQNTPIIFIPKGTSPWRMPKTILKALSSISNYHFLAIFSGGNINEKNTVLAMAKKLGLKNRIHFIPEVFGNDLNALYTCSRFIVSIPKRESFGLIPLEALACGTPSIISSSSGISEILRNGEGIISIDSNNFQQLSFAMKLLLFNDQERQKIVSRGYEKLKEFDIKRFIYEMYYQLQKISN